MRFDVRGMTCASCVGRVEKAIAAVPGVATVTVNLATESAQVALGEPEPVAGASASSTAAAIEAAVRAAGYDAKVVGSALAQKEPAGAAPVDSATEDEHALGLAQERATRVTEVRRLAEVACVLLALLIPIAMLLPAFPGHMWVEFVLATAIVLGTGGRFFRNALAQARHAAANMDTLIALGALAAWLLSLYGLFTHDPSRMFFETAGAIVAFALVGRYLEERAKLATGDALTALYKLRPETALALDPDGSAREVPLGSVRVGMLMRVLPGQRVPVDGLVRTGESAIDESLLTGEPMPIDKAPGARVLAGSINGEGALDIEATRVGADTTLGQIAHLLAEAQGSRAPIQHLADRVSAVFVPAVLGIALAVTVIFLLRGANLVGALLPAVAVLVVACPCALGLATPTAMLVATGAAARRGILIANLETIERAERVRAVVLDKTGTLTEGRPQVLSFQPSPGVDPLAVLPIVAGCEARSEHPLGQALLAYAGSTGLPPHPPTRFRAVPGHGVVAEVDGEPAVIGNRRLLEREGVAPPPDHEARPTGVAHMLATTPSIYVAIAGQVRGRFLVGDRIRDSAPTAVQGLQSRGLDVYLVTGDSRAAAEAVAAQVGIDADRVHAEALPQDKRDFVASLRADGAVVAMVGDGINDAPALAAADVGIAVGGGAQVAAEAAHVTLQRADPSAIADLLALSRRTMRVIRQNLAWAFGYNLVALAVAASGLLGPRAPMLAAAAMAFSSFTVVSNSLRLK
ncbi:MAG TPA: heavy metal translocating P-type ATPase [Polyangia bacterium]|nr:heavy metal translocating P-type ATPase [Polyangia bacterium]